MSETAKNENGKAGVIILIVAAVVIAIVAAIVLLSAPASDGTGQDAMDEVMRHETQVVAMGENMKIPTDEVKDGPHFYPVEVDGVEMEVIAVRDTYGHIRTAFNTCQSCYNSGLGYYLPKDGYLICQNCGYRYAPNDVEVAANGCNPYPIFEDEKVTTETEILISYEFLKEAEAIFANWHSN